MAQVLIINSETARDGLQYLGDVVAIIPDSWQPSETELVKFDVITIGGSVDDIQARLMEIEPSTEFCYLWESDGDYHWVRDGENVSVEIIEVYQIKGSRKWYKLINDFKFSRNTNDLTAEEKQILETVDINHPSVDAFIGKLIKDVVALPGNNVEVRELRGTNP